MVVVFMLSSWRTVQAYNERTQHSTVLHIVKHLLLHIPF